MKVSQKLSVNEVYNIILNNILSLENEMIDLFSNIEMPLTHVLADMELTGIRVDKEYLKEN